MYRCRYFIQSTMRKDQIGIDSPKGNTYVIYIKTSVSNVGRMKSEDIKLVSNLTAMNLMGAKIFDKVYTLHYII